MISTAILLAAGEGSRLRSAAPFKPLCTVAGHSLLSHALHGLAEAGLKRVIVVLGYGADEIATHIAEHDCPILVETVTTHDYRHPNVTSVLGRSSPSGRKTLCWLCGIIRSIRRSTSWYRN